MTQRPLATTCVIGAGPPGLLFSLTARIRYLDAGGNPADWALLLFDKRTEYVRTHRLRMDPHPRRRLGDELDSPLYADFVAFLAAEDFKPAVNRLEAELRVIAAVLLGTFVDPPLGWVWPLPLPVEAAGGFAYEKGRTLEPLPNRWLGNVWRLQLAVLLAAGLPSPSLPAPD